jgi:hypothetical protein
MNCPEKKAVSFKDPEAGAIMKMHQCFSARLTLCLSFLTAGLCTTLASERVQIVRTPNNGAVPDAEVDRNGAVHVAFVAGQDAFYVKSSDNGKTFSPPLRINSEAGSVHPPNMFRGPDIALGKGGRVHVVWYGNGYQRKLPPEEWGVFYSHLDAGQNAFSPTLNLNHKPSDNYSITADENGDVAVVWMAKKLYVNTSRDNGDAFADAEAVPVAHPCECCASRAFFSKNGTLYIDYREKANNMRDMYLLTRATGDAAFSKQKISTTPWQVNACPMAGTFLTGAKNGLVVAWETKSQIFYGRIDRGAGFLPPKEIRAAAKGKWPVALAALDGTVLVSWKNDSTLNWQLYDAADKPLGTVETKPSANATRHAGTVAQQGNFLLID